MSVIGQTDTLCSCVLQPANNIFFLVLPLAAIATAWPVAASDLPREDISRFPLEHASPRLVGPSHRDLAGQAKRAPGDTNTNEGDRSGARPLAIELR